MPLFRKEEPRPAVRRVLVATDRSETAERAVSWAAELANRYEAELVLLQVRLPDAPSDPSAEDDLAQHAQSLAGARGRAVTAIDTDPANAICEASEQEDVDVVVVGNLGMSGRKEFLLGNVPNRVSHNVRRTVVIVNTQVEPAKRGFFR